MSTEPDYRILLVEDSPTQRLELQHFLEQNGFVVDTAASGREALERLEAELPNLVISDIVMPDIDGYELCRRIKASAEWSALPVVLLTSLRDPRDVMRGLECGADNFLTKPYRPEILLSRVRYLRLNRELRMGSGAEAGVEILFAGQKHFLSSDRLQILDHLLASYEEAINRSEELQTANSELLDLKATLERQNALLEQHNTELARLNEEKNEIIGTVAHDLRNPLGIVAGYAALLRTSGAEIGAAENQQLLERVEHTSAFMLRLVNDILDLAAIEAGKVKLQPRSTDLSELIQRHLEASELLARGKNLRFEFLATGEIPEVVVDPEKMEQVLYNLVGNAMKFSPPGARIAVELQAQERGVQLTVRDDGPGIPMGEQADLFEAFTTTSVRSDGAEGGTGLGLAIVRRIVESHGGRIWVESDRNRGSAFHVALPLQPAVATVGGK